MKITSYSFPVCKSLNEAVVLKCGENVTIKSRQTVMGGDANDAYLLHLSNGEKAFIKVNVRGNADFFWEEARGLRAIESTGTMRVPKIYAAGTDGNISFLLMEYINSGCLSQNFWESLGTGLAKMHQADTSVFVGSGKEYGFITDNYIGAGKQKNTPKTGWIEFFAECRLKPQFKLAERYFDSYLIKAANNLLDNLDKYLYEPERPSLLHGDLWAGNFMADENGEPMLIDPAVYVGCNEADIAMTELFGGFDNRFYEAYFDAMGRIPGYEDRRDLYNLYHLTNHLNLFGRSYLSAVIRIINKYSS